MWTPLPNATRTSVYGTTGPVLNAIANSAIYPTLVADGMDTNGYNEKEFGVGLRSKKLLLHKFSNDHVHCQVRAWHVFAALRDSVFRH